MTTPPLIRSHGVALVGSHIPTTALTGRPSSARMAFFDDWTRRSRNRYRTHINGTPTNPGHFRIVYYDEYTRKRYGAIRSHDLKKWEVVDVTFPAGARHGTAF